MLYSYIIGSDERLIKFRIDRTGSDVIMVTESFSSVKGHNEGHTFKIYGTIEKALS